MEATLCNSSTIVCNYALLLPPFCFFIRKLSSLNDDNCRQSWTIVEKYLKRPFAKPPLRLSRLPQVPQKGRGMKSQINAFQNHTFQIAMSSLKTLTSLNKELRFLHFSFFLSDNSIWGQWTRMLQMLWSQGWNSLEDPQMLESLREETEGKLQMLLSPRKNGLTSLFKEVRVFKALPLKERRQIAGSKTFRHEKSLRSLGGGIWDSNLLSEKPNLPRTSCNITYNLAQPGTVLQKITE